MGGKGKSKPKASGHVCGACTNFKVGKAGTEGRCMRKNKKRDSTDTACGSYEPRKKGT